MLAGDASHQQNTLQRRAIIITPLGGTYLYHYYCHISLVCWLLLLHYHTFGVTTKSQSMAHIAINNNLIIDGYIIYIHHQEKGTYLIYYCCHTTRVILYYHLFYALSLLGQLIAIILLMPLRHYH